MNSKANKTTKPKIKKVDKVKVADVPSVDKDESKSGFDMGGIPQRDLKKNLGCW
jgi:hypothetical protein